MQHAQAPGDTHAPNQQQSGPGHYYMTFPESKYTDLTVNMFVDAILDLDYKCLNYCHYTDPDWMDTIIRCWEVQKALSVITPSACTYKQAKKSTDISLVWGVLAHVQTRKPNRVLERHLAAVMPVFIEHGWKVYQEMRENGDLDPGQYQKPLISFPHVRNQVSHFFHCLWGHNLDEYLPSPYQMHRFLWEIQPDAMQYYFHDVEKRPPHERVIADLKAEALRAYTRGEAIASGRGVVGE